MPFNKIIAESMDLTDTYAFTGTVSGAGGITEADQWRVSSSFGMGGSSSTVITSNLERVDTNGYGRIGTGMTESSGVFTFPSTGIWKVAATGVYYDNATWVYCTMNIEVSTDGGSNYSSAAAGTTSANRAAASPEQTCYCETLLDCTNTSNFKVRFKVTNDSQVTNVYADSNTTVTGFTFIRLGDT